MLLKFVFRVEICVTSMKSALWELPGQVLSVTFLESVLCDFLGECILWLNCKLLYVKSLVKCFVWLSWKLLGWLPWKVLCLTFLVKSFVWRPWSSALCVSGQCVGDRHNLDANYLIVFTDLMVSPLSETLLISCSVSGNVFVIAAILLERNLQNVANYLIVSLAVADLMVACLVMPLGAVYEVNHKIFIKSYCFVKRPVIIQNTCSFGFN